MVCSYSIKNLENAKSSYHYGVDYVKKKLYFVREIQK